MFGKEFFPTPWPIARKMLDKVSDEAVHFLEPSAGKGDIADVIKAGNQYPRRKVDCIEMVPELVAVLNDKGHDVVGFDWLTYDGVCYYDAILMNPPFSDGDKHLLRAYDFMHSGEIVCLLNEETIKNPFSADRQRLQLLIERHGSVEYLGDVFSKGAERKTGVNVAMVYLKKECEDDRLDLWATEAMEQDQRDGGVDIQALAVQDKLGNIQRYYDEANKHMLVAFQHLRKARVFMEANDIRRDFPDELFSMAQTNYKNAYAEFIQAHRKNAWMSVFNKMDFRKFLDKKQTDEFIKDIERNDKIPFTKENIKGTLQNVFLQRGQLFEKSVANVFDELTRYYAGNTNHREGWKSNDNYKVNKKIVFPYGCRFEWGRFGHCFGYSKIDIYNDLDRIMCVLAGEDFAECNTIAKAMDERFRRLGEVGTGSFDGTCESRFFDIRFFKKGTVHLVFRDESLLAEFNRKAAAGKAWLGADTRKKGE